MAKFEIVMPKMGESVIEATITRWMKGVGDTVEEDDPIVEIATDKVDSEIPSPVEGKIVEAFFSEGDVVAVGKVIAIVEIEGEEEEAGDASAEKTAEPAVEKKTEAEKPEETAVDEKKSAESSSAVSYADADRFYSPLVKQIAKTENISLQELESIEGSGKDGRVNKNDVLSFLENRGAAPKADKAADKTADKQAAKPAQAEAPKVSAGAGDQVIQMDRMRRLIADHMVMSKQVSPHVTSFIDVDVTNIVNWRNKVKDSFQKREGQKITYTPIFFEAAAKALKDYPQVNASVDGYNMVLRKNINIGMATALPNGNLIVPVIKNVDEKNLLGITKNVNDLANRARNNKLDPDEIQGGTFTITNFGSFDSLTGTPIINQPQVAILAVGAIRKQPAVLETEMGDVIAIRHIMILALAYDHRIVDGALGGLYLKRMKELLENFDPNREV
ncbi:MAG: 2-oxo acid dehydrogenase subunit E2 [Bacteroidetes bacterium]|nr:2-oxo acid dehydrogenase subunit E2 [Bacteroidota bacterium]MBU1580918.1 2-oxo acid dehydrogenase subunit E2 [Bacteroidota bacterium]MBU2466056.1 2-oxo acid dehydrogenase subunit E2 [Bacteroidota bacterium]MBU2557817.1 2-oxo acid dehydrogenase subunit E2 [Bacteroidota bacterium]